MTAQEAMERARIIGKQNVRCLMNAMRSGGSGADIDRAVEVETRAWAAALIRAQIEVLRRVGEPVYTLEADPIQWPDGPQIIQECEDALAELEASDG